MIVSTVPLIANPPGAAPRPAPPKGPVAKHSAETIPFTFVVVDQEADLAPHLSSWDDLATAALEPNVFYESWMLLPALRAFAAGKQLQFVLIFTPDPARPHGPPLLCGFFPLERRRGYKGLPVSVLGLWKHIHCFLCTPLLRAQYAAPCLAAFFDWLAADPRGSGLFELDLVPGEGPFQQLLVDELCQRRCLTYQAESYTRAVFRPRADAETYLAAALTGKSRKKLRRQRNHLAEMGRLVWTALEPGGNADGWIDQFLQLEASGWKGRQGTAFQANAEERTFFKTIAAEAFARGRLLLLALHLDGRPIALQCNFLAGRGAFAFKIAFDESYARFSPGVLLELENIRRLHDHSTIQWMDSCAVETDVTNKRLWIDRRIIQSVLVSTGRRGGDFLVALLPVCRWLSRTLFGRRRSPGEVFAQGR